ncbi:creatininase family protein [Pelagibius sp. Alg239-R121]|uniref:creatininase family protein n=1 Tax=Pelagibius sp. Alg239-R121 TaxID=2993448 RepID=UPI0024A732DD|nr:creatininase family protein [Pelagibius sp. Alg239-R121]
MLRYWQDLTTDDFADLDPETTVAIMPLGAIEQHGPHLPVSTDAVIAEEMAKRSLQILPEAVPALLMPTQAIGKSNEHLAFAGTLTLTPKTLIDVWYEVAEGIKRAGLSKILFVNAHGGQPQVMEIVARELRVKQGILAVTSSWWHMGLPEGLVAAEEIRHGIHGGTVETSIMRYLRPDLVKMDKAANFVSVLPETESTNERLRYVGGVGIGWQAQDLHPLGVAGDASAATTEIGEAVVKHATSALAQLITEVSRHPLSSLVSR